MGITTGLGTYVYVQKAAEKPKPVEKPPVITEEPEPEPEKIAEITNFEGYYDVSKKLVRLDWDYEEHASKITQVRLLYSKAGDSINVAQFSSYDLPIDAFGLPTGNNAFTLRLILDNEEVIEETVYVKINYVLSVEQRVEQGDHRTRVTLDYQYDRANPVNAPSIQCMSDVDCSMVAYVDTKVVEENGRLKASTTYEFTWKETPVTYETFYVRWNFKDDQQIIYQNFDFEVTKGNK